MPMNAHIFGGAEGIRTPDPLHAMQVRYQLRHSPIVRDHSQTTFPDYYTRGVGAVHVSGWPHICGHTSLAGPVIRARRLRIPWTAERISCARCCGKKD